MGGGIGDALIVFDFDWKYLALRYVFDLSFFIIVIVIGLNVIFGIIVDTFSELRDEKRRIEDDIQNYCFICSLPRFLYLFYFIFKILIFMIYFIFSAEFDRNSPGGFHYHSTVDHNMWNYLLFAVYLTRKDPFEYNSREGSSFFFFFFLISINIFFFFFFFL